MAGKTQLACCAAGLLLVGACGGSKLRTTGTGHSADLMFAGTVPERPPPFEAVSAPRAEVDRAAVEGVVDQGLGRFLQWLEIEPVHRKGAFAGFRVVALKHPALSGLGIREGDIVTRLNGLPIGLPEEALEAWDRTRNVSEIVVDYERKGELRQLRIPVTD